MWSSNKIIVFDMDETLGYFVELGMFWDALQYFYKNRIMTNINMNYIMSNEHFNKVLDLFPEFLRPDIIKILKYVVYKKNNKQCDKILIYTNNQAPKQWALYISSYFEYIFNNPVFDMVIGAYKVNGTQIELDRTTHDKTMDDLDICAKLHKHTDICFIDDQYHPYMYNERVYYINVKPYVYSLKYEEMAERYYDAFNDSLLKTNMNIIDKNYFINEITGFMNNYKYTITKKNKKDLNVDKYISKQILSHLKYFFKDSIHNKTIKKIKKMSNSKKKKMSNSKKNVNIHHN